MLDKAKLQESTLNRRRSLLPVTGDRSAMAGSSAGGPRRKVRRLQDGLLMARPMSIHSRLSRSSVRDTGKAGTDKVAHGLPGLPCADGEIAPRRVTV